MILFRAVRLCLAALLVYTNPVGVNVHQTILTRGSLSTSPATTLHAPSLSFPLLNTESMSYMLFQTESIKSKLTCSVSMTLCNLPPELSSICYNRLKQVKRTVRSRKHGWMYEQSCFSHDTRTYIIQYKIHKRIRKVVWRIKMSILRFYMPRHEYRNVMQLKSDTSIYDRWNNIHSALRVTVCAILDMLSISRRCSLSCLTRSKDVQLTEHYQDCYTESTLTQSLPRHRTGGGVKKFKTIEGERIHDYVVHPIDYVVEDGKEYKFVSYVHKRNLSEVMLQHEGAVVTNIPLSAVCHLMSIRERQLVGRAHGITMSSRLSVEANVARFSHHYCPACEDHYTLFVEQKTESELKKDKSIKLYEWKKQHPRNLKKQQKRRITSTTKKTRESTKTGPYKVRNATPAKFPPDPPSQALLREIINGYCADMEPEKFEEEGCAVCGQLTPIACLDALNKHNTECLYQGQVTRKERQATNDPIEEKTGAILASGCDSICVTCADSLKENKIPSHSLANGFWIGDIPAQLRGLTFVEQMLIAKVRHNRCLIRVASGRAKMIANCIMFANPTARVSNVLPPSREELSEVLAVVFIGAVHPTEDHYRRTPVLVRRNKVREALDWLKLNHDDYWDLEISLENLESYPLSGVPLDPEYKHIDSESNKIPTAMSKFDEETEEGTEDGPCPFTVHGLTGEEYEKMDMKEVKIRTLRYLEQGGLSLGIGHDPTPQSMYDNPQLYPQMFPWLFPYGKGGIGQERHKKKISRQQHKRMLLMYYDKRFQTDLYFPIIAFNEEQIKTGTTGSFLLAKRKNFAKIVNRIQSINPAVLDSIANRMASGERVVAQNESEKMCFEILDDIDYVGGFVPGSLTNKKYMRNEIWSMVSWKGAPSWFITISPADSKHPLCMYFADKDATFTPEIRSAKIRNLLVLNNPVAAARFFDFMIKLLLKHVFGIGTDHPGLYGKTSSYYGTVEQQGRLTLHLHMLLWIEGALSPQEIRDRIINHDSEFSKELVAYLESVHTGEILNGKANELREKLGYMSAADRGIHNIVRPVASECGIAETVKIEYQDPTLTMPVPMPCPCPHKHATDSPNNSDDLDDLCTFCNAYRKWNQEYNTTVDDLLVRSNMHTCRATSSSKRKKGNSNYNEKEDQAADDGRREDVLEAPMSKASRSSPKGCLNKDGVCMARFPREVRHETEIDYTDGHIFMRHGESMMNTFSRCLTYLTRCNTDVTSLLSGTSIKAVISYVTDYVTKPTMKTHQIFSAAYDVYGKVAEGVLGDSKPSDAARRLILKVVNALSSKSEIGSPMASMYLLGNPDHYTSHEFVTFWWRAYASEIARQSNSNVGEDDEKEEIGTDEVQVAEGDSTNTTTDKPTDKLEDPQEGEELQKDDKPGQNEEENDRLVIGKENGKYFARSNVDDYKFRPKCYSNISLINWIRGSKKYKIREKKSSTENEAGPEAEAEDPNMTLEERPTVEICEDDVDAWEDESDTDNKQIKRGRKSKYHRFSKDHPLYKTHKVTYDEENIDKLIPNFVGGTLPRSDHGDREYYCMTMLVIFKPWRSVSDLKGEGQNWDESFTNHRFSGNELKLMNNFNLKYECLDSRDDFHSELKKKINRAAMQNESEGDDSDESSDEDYTQHGGIEFGERDPNRYMALCTEASNRLKNKYTMAKILGHIQWPKILRNESLKAERLIPEERLGSTGWTNRVKECRDKAVKEKFRHAPVQKEKERDGKSCIAESTVKLVEPEWFCKDYKTSKKQTDDMISEIVKQFSLNNEQERAFRLIANHAATPSVEPLKMYLGGMGGTGKTQVIKAVIEMFARKNKSHRFIVLGPTGTAAALLNGSTYHSALGIRIHDAKEAGMTGSNANSINDLREKLAGVEYIFIDEVSMISCHELYAISAKLAILTNVHDKPFGGMNMVFAGDFAQLPPVKGKSLYSNDIMLQQSAGSSVRSQEETIGKILWSQVTTVVILKQNMRQKSQTEDDARLRAALENMRYGACTPADIDFLRSRVSSTLPGRPDVRHQDFRNVSIITGLNVHKDMINEIGCSRFAEDTGQTLTEFHSIDINGDDDQTGSRKRKRKRGKRTNSQPRLDDVDKETLWGMDPCATSHIAGKLKLCPGMPVMIRHNYATELCITKGQEGTVVGWESFEGPDGRNCLETLFIKLSKPPKDIQIPGLPQNVVPITKSTTSMKVMMPNGREISIKRTQVVVLPNFAMTDYASQGKTRPFNVVDLGNCRSHQSYYTCLSRSASAEGTILVQAFNPNIITRGISGYLRQEFRELETLNVITALKYERRLPDSVKGILRYTILSSYRAWSKGKDIVIDCHPALDMQSFERSADMSSGFDRLDEKTIVQASVKLPTNTKGRNTKKDAKVKKSGQPISATVSKKSRSNNMTQTNRTGSIWDSENYSCAYDSVCTVMYNTWLQENERGRMGYENGNEYMKILDESFRRREQSLETLEEGRDRLRRALNAEDPVRFPYGKTNTVADNITLALVGKTTIGTCEEICERCRNIVPRSKRDIYTIQPVQDIRGEGHGSRLLSEIANMKKCNTDTQCTHCAAQNHDHNVANVPSILSIPAFMIIEIWRSTLVFKPDVLIPITSTEGQGTLRLAGIIYGDGTHFVSRIIDPSGQVWFHDGIETGSSLIEEGLIDTRSDTTWLLKCGQRTMVSCIYTRVQRE